MMTAKVVTRESFTIVGYQYQANLKEIEEQKLGKKTLTRLKKKVELVKNKAGAQVYLIQAYEMKPDFNPNVDRFTQVIGYKVSKPHEIPEGMISHTLPESRYVTTTHKGLETDLNQTYDYLYGKWFTENPYYPAGYDFEIWDERYKPEEAGNEIDVYIAMKSM
ncbi:GyrI-like domain-containing protein [Alteribacter populi]|uniref:GyrI-like domain-containing protein n=1 Tax=Alteribacter populi TaxID=2011011 RepID=UPI001E6128BB|nr:GyrI-like domain-containing protein [Alteribacter populi]